MRDSRRVLTVCALLLIGLACARSFGRAGQPPEEAPAGPSVDRAAATQAIDRFIEGTLREKQLAPLPVVGDEKFVRRIYLDVVGRIPTLDEAQAFLSSAEPNKRAVLIDQLLRSPGHVSHEYNFWADILRVKDNDGGISRAFYITWIKDSITANKPYDQFVRELVTASGSGWERGNGAVGYYFRDRGMPLDNMANTLRIFAGTRIACAQCHDDPHDKWTRRQLFEMAAFTSNLKTENMDQDFRGMVRREKTTTDQELKTLSQIFRNTFHRDRVLGQSDGTIKLPADYQYEDGKPRQVISAHPIFGPNELSETETKADYRERFGDWLTSPDNERFTQVIANRLWKRVMGRGLIEPVDDLRDNTQASHPELLAYLTQLMKDLRYDMRAYVEVLYNTQTYQRSTDPDEPADGESNFYRGHLLKRMTAEQAWDSLLTLSLANVDARESGLDGSDFTYGGHRVFAGKDDMYSLYDKVKDLSPEEHWDFISAFRTAMKSDIESQVAAAKADPKLAKPLYNFMTRASELSDPAAPSHFLRTFGQSNREFIEGGSTASNVTQFLSMFNGFVESQVLQNPDSELMKKLSGEQSPGERCDIAFLSILSRQPTADERSLTAAQGEGDGKKQTQDLAWALLNSEEFLFVE